jgi:uncharacterized membrane protein YeiH
MDVLLLFDLLGTAAFAVSGVLSAFKHKIDVVGAFFVGFVAAMGGGIIRDAILGRPASTFENPLFLEVVLVAVLLTYLAALKLHKYLRLVLIFDAIGLAAFSLITYTRLEATGLALIQQLFLALLTAAGGGIIRDVLMNEIPLIFRKGLYVTCALFGLLLYGTLEQASFTPQSMNILLAGSFIVALRIFSVRRDMHLPSKTVSPHNKWRNIT